MKPSKKVQIEHVFSEVKKYLGIEENNTSKTEKLISGLGAMISIYLCQLMTAPFITQPSSLLLIASMGATATLIYALPHGALSQPWNVLGGHLVSAFVGVLCYQHMPDSTLSGAVAVGVAVLAMYFLRCLHPPGGATALFCTQGGEQVYELGFSFLWQPLLANVLIIIFVGVIFNSIFSWRRYPAHLNFKDIKGHQSVNHLSHEDFSAALMQLDSFVDITTEELAIIFDRALIHASTNKPNKKQLLEAERFYSNGSLGESWNIKQIINIDKAKVQFKIIAGNGQGMIKEASQRRFKKWVKFEVEFSQGSWVKR